jgi:hypothetical protein
MEVRMQWTKRFRASSLRALRSSVTAAAYAIEPLEPRWMASWDFTGGASCGNIPFWMPTSGGSGGDSGGGYTANTSGSGSTGSISLHSDASGGSGGSAGGSTGAFGAGNEYASTSAVVYEYDDSAASADASQSGSDLYTTASASGERADSGGYFMDYDGNISSADVVTSFAGAAGDATSILDSTQLDVVCHGNGGASSEGTAYFGDLFASSSLGVSGGAVGTAATEAYVDLGSSFSSSPMMMMAVTPSGTANEFSWGNLGFANAANLFSAFPNGGYAAGTAHTGATGNMATYVVRDNPYGEISSLAEIHAPLIASVEGDGSITDVDGAYIDAVASLPGTGMWGNAAQFSMYLNIAGQTPIYDPDLQHAEGHLSVTSDSDAGKSVDTRAEVIAERGGDAQPQVAGNAIWTDPNHVDSFQHTGGTLYASSDWVADSQANGSFETHSGDEGGSADLTLLTSSYEPVVGGNGTVSNGNVDVLLNDFASGPNGTETHGTVNTSAGLGVGDGQASGGVELNNNRTAYNMSATVASGASEDGSANSLGNAVNDWAGLKTNIATQATTTHSGVLVTGVVSNAECSVEVNAGAADHTVHDIANVIGRNGTAYAAPSETSTSLRSMQTLYSGGTPIGSYLPLNTLTLHLDGSTGDTASFQLTISRVNGGTATTLFTGSVSLTEGTGPAYTGGWSSSNFTYNSTTKTLTMNYTSYTDGHVPVTGDTFRVETQSGIVLNSAGPAYEGDINFST